MVGKECVKQNVKQSNKYRRDFMDRQEAKKLRAELEKVLKLFDSSYTVTVGNCTYTSEDATFKLTIAPEGALSKEERDLAYFADMNGGSMIEDSPFISSDK